MIAFESCLPTVKLETTNRDLKARMAVSSTFLGVLELARGGEISAMQDEGFASIAIQATDCERAASTR